MSEIRETVEELADRLASVVGKIVKDRVTKAIASELAEQPNGKADAKSRVALPGKQAHYPAPAKPSVGEVIAKVKRGRKPVPLDLKPICAEKDGKPVLAKGLCRYHYYKARRAILRNQQGAQNGASATAS